MIKNLVIYSLLFSVFWVTACKKPYEPSVITADNSFLVIDGVINAEPNAPTTIVLSRTKRLTDTTINVPELFAQVSIEGEDGSNVFLSHIGNGNYVINQLNINTNKKYRLKIATTNGKQYLSDFVPVKQTPSLNITWKQEGDVTVYVNANDPSNNTRYYRWEATETWEYHAIFETVWGKRGNRIFVHDSSTQTSICWKTNNATDILLASTVQLSQDIVNEMPIAKIRKNSEPGYYKYSILVKQYALTQEGYQYWQILKKNTQQLGTIFDPQPSQLNSNIRCITNPGEPVVGYVSICSIKERRIFIKYEDLIEWQKSSGTCETIEISKDPTDVFNFYYDPAYSPYYFVTGGGLVVALNACLDCRIRGGSNIKPNFW